MSTNARNKQLTIRVSTEERKQLTATAEQHNMSVSDYVRFSALGGTVSPAVNYATLPDRVTELETKLEAAIKQGRGFIGKEPDGTDQDKS